MKKIFRNLGLMLLAAFLLPVLNVKAATCSASQDENYAYYIFADVEASDSTPVTTAIGGTDYTYYTSASKYNTIPKGTFIDENDHKQMTLQRTGTSTLTSWTLDSYWTIFKAIKSSGDANYVYKDPSGNVYYIAHGTYKWYANATDLANDTNSNEGNTNTYDFSGATNTNLANASVLPTTAISAPESIGNATATTATSAAVGDFLRWTVTRTYKGSDFAGTTPISLTNTSGTTKDVYYAPAVYYASFCTDKAKWNLIYNANGYSVTVPATTSADCGTNQSVSSTALTLSGKKFLGWSRTAGSKTAEIKAGDTITSSASSCSDVTLYAVFEDAASATWTITYNANGYKITVPAATTANCGVDQKISTDKPELSGYTFVGWSVATDKDKVAYTGGETIGSTLTACSDLTVYAVYTVKTGLTNNILILAGILLVSGAGYYVAKKKNIFKKIRN